MCNLIHLFKFYVLFRPIGVNDGPKQLHLAKNYPQDQSKGSK